jgi:hypothetical protein
MALKVKEVRKAIRAMEKTFETAKKRRPKAVGGQEQQQQQQQQKQQEQQEQEQEQQMQQIAGNVKVYTGPKQGKFIINKHGKKVYIDRKTLNKDIPYLKKKAKK